MSNEKPLHGERWRITVDAQYVAGGWWRTGGDLLKADDAAIKSIEPIPDPPYTPQVGDWFTSALGNVWYCIAAGLAVRPMYGKPVCEISDIGRPFTKVAAP